MPQDDPESEDREEITDPVSIEYRDGLFYCIEEDQQPAEIEAEIQWLGSRVHTWDILTFVLRMEFEYFPEK